MVTSSSSLVRRGVEMDSSSTHGMLLATLRIRSLCLTHAIIDSRYIPEKEDWSMISLYSCSPHLETSWPNTGLTVSFGSTLTALEGFPSLQTIRLTIGYCPGHAFNPILKAVVTDFNNHRLLVIKADFQGAQVRHFAQKYPNCCLQNQIL